MKRIHYFLAITIVSATAISCGTQRNIITFDNQSYNDETVNVGYGNITKDEMTNRTSIISPENTPNVSYKDITEYLQGKVAGVQVQDTGDSEPNIIIRGAGTLNSGTKPLYILDGIEIPTIGQLDPNEIYSVEILRDSSASIYGVKAANGVLIFTTKSRHELEEQERIQKMEARQAKKEARK